MKTKLPPKLLPPFTFAEWLDLDYTSDPKFTKALKMLNLALKELKATKPPTAEAFEEFTTQTAYLIKRLRKMLKTELPSPVEEFCTPFLKQLLKWQKGALKIQDILVDDAEENAAAAEELEKKLQQALTAAGACEKNYSALTAAVDKYLKGLKTLGALVAKNAAAPQITTQLDTLRSGKNLRALQDAHKKCSDRYAGLSNNREIRNAAPGNDDDPTLAKLITSLNSILGTIGKIDKTLTASLADCAKITAAILKTSDKAKSP